MAERMVVVRVAGVRFSPFTLLREERKKEANKKMGIKNKLTLFVMNRSQLDLPSRSLNWDVNMLIKLNAENLDIVGSGENKK